MKTTTRKPCKRRFWLWLLVTGTITLLVRRRNSVSGKGLFGPLRSPALKLSRAWNLRVPWTELPYVLALFNFIGMRELLRDENLVDTQTLPSVDPDVDRPPDTSYLHARSPDGVYNDLSVPLMGSKGTRFGRNVPLIYTYPDEAKLLTPNPRTVSLELLTRDEFLPATILNTLAAAWIQFMVHDWLSHGKNDATRLIEVPLADDDPWHEHPMTGTAHHARPDAHARRQRHAAHLHQHRDPLVGRLPDLRQQPRDPEIGCAPGWTVCWP